MFTLTAPPPPQDKPQRRVKCDERCRSARGPECNCKCGGKYHGANWNIDDLQNQLFEEPQWKP